MLTVTNDQIHEQLPAEGSDIDFLPFSDLDDSGVRA